MIPSAAMATTPAVASRASTARWLGGGPVAKPASSTHSGTVWPAARPALTGIAPARARPSGAVHRAWTWEWPKISLL